MRTFGPLLRDLASLIVLCYASIITIQAQPDTFPDGIIVGDTSEASELLILSDKSSLTLQNYGTNSNDINFQNSSGFWQFSGPRSFSSNNPFILYWNDGDYHPYLSVLDNGNVGMGTDDPDNALVVKRDTTAAGVIIEGTKGFLELASTGTNPNNLDFYNTNGFWQLSGPRDDTNNPFVIYWNDGSYNRLFTMLDNGNIGVGVDEPDEKLTVDGKVRTEEVIVEVVGGADFVFEESYELPSLPDIESYIKTHKHLPGIKSADEMKEQGLGLGEMNIRLLQKVEELTLHLIALEKEVSQLKQTNIQK